MFIQPVLAVGNNLRARSHPMLLAGEGKSYKGKLSVKSP